MSAIEAIIDEKVVTGNMRYEALLHKDLEILRGDVDKKLEMLRGEMKEQGSRLETKSLRPAQAIFVGFLAFSLL